MMVDVDELLAAIDRDAKVLKNEYAPVRLVADIFKSVIKTVADASGYEMPEWISVKDRMPEEDVYVLAHNGVAPFIAAYTTNPSKRWYAISGFTICPTHWMPLPESPKEEEK